mgnify:CR=1 FL=1
MFGASFVAIAADHPVAQAMAISLITVIATSNFVSQATVGRRLSNVRLAMVLQVVAATGAIVGQNSSTTGRGLLGKATASTGVSYGVYGQTASSSGRPRSASTAPRCA